MEGFLHYRQDAHICGFLFNQLPASLIGSVREMCEALNTSYFGYLPRHDISLESRNLGLVTAAEIPDLQEKMERLGALAAKSVDLGLLLKLSECDRENGTKTVVGISRPAADPPQAAGPVVAVARDEAFCFRYPENIRLLEELGCRIVYFSPMNDDRIPADAAGLYLCGGYPELHARELSENGSMRESVRQAVTGGMPTIAECGGFLYLHRELRMGNPVDAADGDAMPEDTAAAESGIAGAAPDGGIVWPMAGVFDAAAFPKKSLQRFGYITMTARSDNLLCEKGEQIRAHEFHYWDSECPGTLFLAEKQDGRSWTAGIGTENLYAGFPHLYFYARPEMALRFVKKCAAYRRRASGDAE